MSDIGDVIRTSEQSARSSGTLGRENRNPQLETPTMGWAASALQLPSFVKGAVYADSARQAARINALAISKQEERKLLEERATLLDKKFEEELSREENNRLEYVRWSLGRIEDARHGAAIDALESHVEMYENVVGEIKRFREDLEERSIRKRRR